MDRLEHPAADFLTLLTSVNFGGYVHHHRVLFGQHVQFFQGGKGFHYQPPGRFRGEG